MIRRLLQPVWLARPSRYATVSAGQARLVLGAFAGLVILSWTAALASASMAASDVGQASFDQAIVDALRHGDTYYHSAADALRSGETSAPATIRLPTLALVQASLGPVLTSVSLYLLIGGAAAAWFRRLRPAFGRPTALWAATLLFVAGTVAGWPAALTPVHEVWAGLLIALSLARRSPGRWIEAVGWGLLGGLACEWGAPYLLVMLGLAWRDGERREALGWAVAIAALAVVEAAHIHAVAGITAPPLLDWPALVGAGTAFRSWQAWTVLGLLPPALAAPLIVVALAGWTAWRDPLATRVFVTLGAYALVMTVLGTSLTGLLTAPFLLVSLAFAPDGLRDLVAGVFDRRRITVRRVAR